MTDPATYIRSNRVIGRFSVRVKIALLISFFVAVTSFFIGVQLPKIIEKETLRGAQHHANEVIALTTKGLVGPLHRRNVREAVDVLGRLDVGSAVAYAGVEDSGGRVVAWLGSPADSARSHRNATAPAITRHDTVIHLSSDVVTGGHTVGRLFVGFDLSVTNERIRSSISAFRLGSILLLVLGIATAIFASGSVTRPLRGLLQAMSRIAGGDMQARADASSSDELGALGASFNSLVDHWNAATAEVHASEERFRTLVENLSEGLTMASEDETILYSNAAAEEIFGLAGGRLVGRSITEFIDPDQLSTLAREQGIRRSGKKSSYEMDIRRADGQRRTLMITASPRIGARGEYRGSFGLFRDITDQKLDERRLRESEDRLRLALDAAQMGTWSWDFEANRMAWSEQLESIFGLAAGSFSGDPEEYLRTIPGEEQRRARRAMYDALYGWTKDLHSIVHRITRPDGSLRWVEVRGKLYRSDDGRPNRMAGTMADITERRMTERAIEAIVRGTATTTGREFFQDLVRELSRALGVRMAFVARVVPGPQEQLRSLAVADNGCVVPGFECDLAGSPCEHVYGRKPTLFPRGVRELFPNNTMLQDVAAESYFGMPLNSSTNEPLGLIAVIGNTPIDDSEIINSILTVFGARAAAELERLKVEEHVNLLAHAMMSVSESVTIEDMAGNLIFVNDSFEETYGYARTEALGRGRRDLLVASGKEGSVPRGHDVPSIPLRGEEVHRRRGGTTFPAFVSTSVIPGEDGRSRARVTIATDLTASKEAEERLRTTSQMLRTILEVSPLAILLVREDRTVEFWNQAAEQMFGWTADEVIDKHLPFVPPEIIEQTKALQSEVMAGVRITNHETTRLRKDGSILDVSISASGIPDASGKIVRMMGIITDISEQKRAEAEVRKLSVAVEQSQVSIVITNSAGAIEYVNPFFTRATGYSRNEAIGQNPRILKSGETSPEVYRELWQMLASGKEWRGELHNRRKNGELFWEFASISPVRDASGQTTHYLAVKEDITERKRVEDEVQRLNEELERRVVERTAQLQAANRELEAFSYSVSHDLRAPLRHVSGYVEMLKEHVQRALDPTSERYLEAITSSSKRMGILIDDLLAFSRLGRTELRRHPVELESVIREVLTELEPDITGRKVSFTIHPLPIVHADRTLLKQVAANLLSNAVKFTRGRDHAVIEVGCRPEPDALGNSVFFVRDNGAGFDMAYSDKLFGVFQRLHTTEEFEGTGIGLANVRRIVHRHGGTTWAEGGVDAGATFYFSLSS